MFTHNRAIENRAKDELLHLNRQSGADMQPPQSQTTQSGNQTNTLIERIGQGLQSGNRSCVTTERSRTQSHKNGNRTIGENNKSNH